MENTFQIKLNTNQIISIIQQLDDDERIAVLKEFSDEWRLIMGLSKPQPMTLEEYNLKLEQGLKDYQNGNFISHQQLNEEIVRWKTKKT
jgi:hypothetical protein